MKYITLFVFFLSFVAHAVGPDPKQLALLKARKYGAQAKEIISVVDQDGKIVENADIMGSLSIGWGPKDYTSFEGKTSESGEYVIEGKCGDGMCFRIIKDGYYETFVELKNYGYSHKLIEGKWHPYGETRKIILNKIINPKPMVHRNSLIDFKLPVYDEWVAFDFEKYDFVLPYGNGVEKDVLLRFTQRKSGPEDLHVTMEISFTNNPFAGVYEMKKNKTSEFQSVYNADTNAIYRSSLSARFDLYPDKMPIFEGTLTEDEYLIFRTRTKVDEKGNLLSAHYGKIYGEWKFFEVSCMSIRKVVFNTTPNDPNLEDDFTANRSISARRNELRIKNRKKRKSRKE